MGQVKAEVRAQRRPPKLAGERQRARPPTAVAIGTRPSPVVSAGVAATDAHACHPGTKTRR